MEYICSRCAIMTVYERKNLFELKNGVLTDKNNVIESEKK